MFTSRFLMKASSAMLVLLVALSSVQPALAAPPLNDNFADSEAITSLPFSGTADTTEATSELNEPQYCWSMNNTVWYSFTPDHNMAVHLNISGSSVDGNVNLYRSTDGTFSGLSALGCAYFGNSTSFYLEAGQTYYLQAGSIFGELGNIRVNLEEFTPPPVQPNFSYYPSDPNPFDVTQFCDNSYDPAGFGFSSFTWSFGDGATSTVNCAQHQYARDGDYTVQHSMTTSDGRIGSTSQVVHVRTHDVAITKIAAPQSANSGQTRSITVYVSNKSYAETVVITLFRSVLGGFESVGSYSQYVPARSANRTVAFTFNYTFTNSDASIGKISFRADANILNARDAFPADNELISSPPTKVGR
jgi:hypothetical protein